MNKKITITIQERENGQYLAEVQTMGEIIQVIADSKKWVLNTAKAETLQMIVWLLESSDIDINNIRFKVNDLTIKGKLFMKIRTKLSSLWKIFINWSREEPYFEYFFGILLSSYLLYMLLLVALMAGLIMFLIQHWLINNQFFVPIISAIIALLGVLLSVAIQGWIAFYKHRDEQQKNGIKKMSNYYEMISKILKKPGKLSLEEICNLIDEFDCKIEIYGSTNIVYQWKKIKERILPWQNNYLKDEGQDLHDFRNFIGAIRKEMGHTTTTSIRFRIYNDLKVEYKKRKEAMHEKKINRSV